MEYQCTVGHFLDIRAISNGFGRRWIGRLRKSWVAMLALVMKAGQMNNTLGQRIVRLVRKILSFPKKLENPIGAVWLFIHHYNALIAERRSL